MNDRSRNKAVTLIGIAGSSACAITYITFAPKTSLLATILLATLAGTLGHFAFTGLGMLLMRLQKHRSYDPQGRPVYAFGRLPIEEAPHAGGKGQVLARLYQSGFPVPDGCILLPGAFDGDEVTAGAWDLVSSQLAHLRRGKQVAFAVRSSALSEDSSQASFAGEFETVLDVQTDEQIRQAIRDVRRSGRSERVQSYSQAKGIAADSQPVAVIIQKLVQAEAAGVLFTADPLTGNRMQMTGNFVRGMGEKLVSGQVSASEFTFKRTEGIYDGPADLQTVAKTLHREAHDIEDLLGNPQDIEWAVEKGKVYILQSRPITTLNGFNPVSAEWNDTEKGSFLWSATNLMEACPEVLTPFTASLLPYVNSIGGPAIDVKNTPMNGIIGGRFYANISVQITAFARAFKGDTHRAYREMAGWWGEIPDDLEIPLLPLTKQEWQRDVLPSLWRTTRLFARYRKQAPAYLAHNRQKCSETWASIAAAATQAQLLELWNGTISPAYRDAMIHIVAAGSDTQVRLERELRELVGVEDANALLSNLGGLSAPLESLGPMAGIGLVARGQMGREEYLERYGHRGVNEGEAAWPRPLEDPHWLDRQLEEWKRSPVDIDALLSRQQAAYQAAWQRFCQKYPGKVRSMQKRIQKAAGEAHRREAMRSEGTRGMTVLRAFALRAGELLGAGEDVFFLTINEVLAGLAGEPCGIQHIPARKQAYQRYRALPPYPSIICGRFDPFAWAADPNRRSDLFDSRAQPAARVEKDAHTITGAPGALGVVEGFVRRLESVEESSQFQKGEVLLTTMTNIGWTPLFPRAAAIITDLGAPLSHAAIVARELGIPAVVGCGDATMRLKTGDRVRVDGGKGTVQILG